MALESGTWVEDLVVTNPPSTDQKSQGDDHLRLIKTVLKNTFKRTSGRAIYFPTIVNKTSSTFSVTPTDDNTIFRCDTTLGNVAINLPLGLTATDAGFKFSVFKVNTGTNPIFIGGSGIPVNNFAFIRRTREFETTVVMWTGAEWTATRPCGLIIGQVVEWYGAALPNGFLWCDGSTFTQNLELQTVLGTNVTPDLRGRTSIGRDNMGVGAAGRVTAGGSGVDGATLKAVGGTETHILVAGQLPAHTHDTIGSTGSTNIDHTHTFSGSGNTSTDGLHTHDSGAGISGAPVLGSGAAFGTPNQPLNTSAAGSHSHTVNVSGTTAANGVTHAHAISLTSSSVGGGAAHLNMQPTIVCNKIIMAE